MATLLQLRQAVSRYLNQTLVNDGADDDIPTSGVFWTQAFINDALNDGYALLYSQIAEVQTPGLVIDGTGTYTSSARSMSLQTLLTITDDPLKIEEVRNITGASATANGTLLPYRIQQERRQGYYGMEPGLSRRYETTTWNLLGTSPMRISLFPTPSADVDLRVRFVPAAPTLLGAVNNKTDIPVAVPTVHHGVLIAYAVWQALLKEESSSWQDFAADFERRRQRLIESVEQRQAQEGRMPRITDPAERHAWLSGSS